MEKCFVIGPFGAPGSEERRWFDFLLGHVVRPALEDVCTVESALDNAAAGTVMERIKGEIESAAVVIADLTYARPNVFYEVGWRHAVGGSCVLLRREGEAAHFDIAGEETIVVQARFDERANDYAVVDFKGLEKRICSQVKTALTERQPARRRRSDDTHQARLYDWSVTYSNNIALDWLEKQQPDVRQAIEQYENRGGIEQTLDEAHLKRFAEYLALKGAANQQYDGKLFYVVNAVSRNTVFGYGLFKFPETTLLIEAKGRDEPDLVQLRFRQPARQVTVFNRSVNLSPYSYGVRFCRGGEAADDGRLRGEILHPDTSTLIGESELLPWLG